MSGGVRPFKHVHGANLDADAVSLANIPVNRDNSAMHTEFSRGFYRPPDIVTLMFTGNLSILLEIRIYWQNNLTFVRLKSVGY